MVYQIIINVLTATGRTGGNMKEVMMYADAAHTGQLRKYTNEPYLVHPFAVAGLVAPLDGSSLAMIRASFLHDVVEDTDTTVEDIREVFGSTVATLVMELTDVSKPSDGNRAVRKKIDRKRIAKISPEAKTIKLADLIDNTKTIVAFDKGFAKIYIAEKRLLLKVLKEGDPTLFKIASSLVERYYEEDRIL